EPLKANLESLIELAESPENFIQEQSKYKAFIEHICHLIDEKVEKLKKLSSEDIKILLNAQEKKKLNREKSRQELKKSNKAEDDSKKTFVNKPKNSQSNNDIFSFLANLFGAFGHRGNKSSATNNDIIIPQNKGPQ